MTYNTNVNLQDLKNNYKENKFDDLASNLSKETDPDLIIVHEIVKLPSKGMFYKNGLSELPVEYLTSKDEDLLTTPSLIENNTVIDILLKRKVKIKDFNPNDLLEGDRNAILLYLRTSSYGNEYTVQIYDPRTNTPFKTTVDLLKLKYKEITEEPNSNGHFFVELPMRKKMVEFRLLTYGELSTIYKKSESIKEAYNQDYSEYNTMKLKAHIVSIDGKTDRSYIDKFIDAMPSLDAFTIRKKILDVSPDIDLEYEFTTKDNFKFKSLLQIGIDFFFPNI